MTAKQESLSAALCFRGSDGVARAQAPSSLRIRSVSFNESVCSRTAPQPHIFSPRRSGRNALSSPHPPGGERVYGPPPDRVPALNRSGEGETTQILTHRLRSLYWPDWMTEWTHASVMAAAPQPYRPGDQRDDAYDLGRVRFFVDQLRAGEEIDPIIIETSWLPGPTPIPLGMFIDDGHHRFAAAVLLRRRRIPASCGGLLELIKWLTGERRSLPLGAA